MKVSKEHYESLKPHYFKLLSKTLKQGVKSTELTNLNKWSLFNKMRNDLFYDDTHPMYQQNPNRRILEHNPNIIISFEGRDSEGCLIGGNLYKDKHVETMLNKFCQEYEKEHQS